jgi:ubiquitin carboxyl-terminal hydrolase 25/28
LHSIIVHDGVQAESGHYYCFIYDRADKIWWRFNDHVASKVDESTVFEEAYGGGLISNKCAYSLIYISKEIAKELDGISFQAYNSIENFK